MIWIFLVVGGIIMAFFFLLWKRNFKNENGNQVLENLDVDLLNKSKESLEQEII